jgi:SAM-dependent methyltransferase
LLTRFVEHFKRSARNLRAPVWCPVCGSKTATFLPLPDFYRDHANEHGFAHFGKGEMTSHETYTCSNCGASDRERLYALWIGQQIERKFFSRGERLVHFAPEAPLSKMIRGLGFFEYSTADLYMDGVDHKVDMMEMPFETDSFDFFICSHVLEHVASDDRAIGELYRITKTGGCGILMAPIVAGLARTIEDASVTDEAGRWRLFGQNDHVRLYAHDDYVNKVRTNGFRVAQFGIGDFGEEVFRLLGLKPTSILYVVSK